MSSAIAQLRSVFGEEQRVYVSSRRFVVTAIVLFALCLAGFLTSMPWGDYVVLFGEIARPVTFEVTAFLVLLSVVLIATLLPPALRGKNRLPSEWIRQVRYRSALVWLGGETFHVLNLLFLTAVAFPILAASAWLSGIGPPAAFAGTAVVFATAYLTRELALLAVALFEDKAFAPYLLIFPASAVWFVLGRGAASPVFYLLESRTTPGPVVAIFVAGIVMSIARLGYLMLQERMRLTSPSGFGGSPRRRPGPARLRRKGGTP